MAITGLNCLITGASENLFVYKAIYNPYILTNYFYSSWYQPGIPAEAPLELTNANYALDTTTGGELPCWALPFKQPEPNKTTYLGACSIHTLNGSSITYLCDRIWQSSGLPISGQSGGPRFQLNSTTFPSRDATGGSNGLNYLVGFEITVESNGNTSNRGNGPFFRYTNSNGVSNRTGVCQIMVFHSQQYVRRGYFYPSTLQEGDQGVRSIQEVWMSGAYSVNHTGTGQIVIYRPLELCEYVTNADSPTARGSSNSLVVKPRPVLYSGTTPFIIAIPQQTISQFQTGFLVGQYNYIST